MNETREPEDTRITRQSKDILNKNGYSFQYSVISKLIETSQHWMFYGSEIPVSTRNLNTHIDLVFQDKTKNVYLIGECKRVQPFFADWVFVKTPFSSRKDIYQSSLVFDTLRESRSANVPEVKKSVIPYTKAPSSNVYGLGFRVKKHLKENEAECQDSIDVINDSIEQVLRSTSGFINLLAQTVQPSNFSNYTFDYHFLPVIFTSANLWVSDTNIAGADLRVGNLEEIETVQSVPYLWYNYNRPKGLSPEFRNFTFYYNQPFSLESQSARDSVMKEAQDYGKDGFEFEDFTRSILIINSSSLSSIDAFNHHYFR